MNSKKINKNMKCLFGKGEYDALEILAKFEDAFLFAKTEKDKCIRLIHGQKSMVRFELEECNESGTLYMQPYKRQLGDIRIILYNPPNKELRQLFIRFKKRERNGTVKIPLEQFRLYLEHPQVESCKGAKYQFDKDVLRTSCYPSLEADIRHAGTLFATAYHDGKEMQFHLTNTQSVIFTQSKRSMVWEVDADEPLHSEILGSVEYCSYIPNFKLFLKAMKEMKIGMPIDYSLIAATISKEDIPFVLKVLSGHDFTYTVKETLGVTTMFLNVNYMKVEE